MQIRHQVSRGLERLMARRAAHMLGEHYGLAGLGACDNFPALEDSLAEAGIPDARKSVDTLRDLHRCGCKRVMKALPLAVDAMRVQAAGGEEALAGIFSKIGKALKKVAKVAVKLSPSHLLLKKVAPKLALLSPSQMLAMKLDPAKAKAASTAIANAGAQSLSPLEAGAAVLANQSGLNLTTPESQAFAQQAVQSAGGGGGGAMPTESMYDTPEGTDDSGTILGVPTPVAIGLGVAGAGILWLAFGGKRRS